MPAPEAAVRPVAAPAGGAAVAWFDAQTPQVSVARSHVRQFLDAYGVDDDVRDAVQLLVSELVTNVIRHSPSTRFGVQCQLDGGAVRVEVYEDLASALPVHALTPPPVAADDATHGRGMGILDVVATEWGVRRRNQLTITWFSLGDPNSLPAEAGVDAAAQAAVVASLQAALGRSRMLLRMVEQLGAATTPEEVGDVITRTVRDYVGAVFSGIALPDPDGETMRYVSLDPLPERTAATWSAFPLDDTSPPAAATLHNRAYFHGTSAAADIEFPGIAAHMDVAGAGSIAHLPLTVAGRSIGTLALTWSAAHEIDPDQRALLLIVAGYAAQALARR